MKKSNWIRAAALLMTVILASGLLAGCGGGTTSSGAQAAYDWTKTDFGGAELNLLVWEQYADESFVKPFEEKYNCKVNATYFASSDDLLAKLKAGGGDTYDVVSPSGDMAGYLVQAGLIDKIDTAHISGWTQIPDVFKQDDVVIDGAVYGIPYTWGPDYVIYDPADYPNGISSWKELWDDKAAGRLSLHDDVSNIYMIGQMLGLDKTDKSAIYNMTDEQLAYAQEQLTLLNKNVVKYWAAGGELEDLFMNDEVDIAVGWPSTWKALVDAGLDLKWCIPEEGCTGWFDRLMIVSGSKNYQLATLWIDWCTSAEGQALTSKVTTFSVSNPEAAQYMTEDEKEIAMVDTMYDMFDSINFWSYVENRAAYNDVWTAVKTTK